MRKVTWYVTGLMLLVLATSAWAGPVQIEEPRWQGETWALPDPGFQNELDEETVIWSENWESGQNGWTYYNALSQPEIYWAADDASANTGTYSWYCSNSEGGYASHWLQWLLTPNLALTTTENPVLTFSFRLSCEGGNWDGAAVWVFYGPDEDNLTAEPLTPTGTPYNNTAPINGFTGEFFLPEGPGWTGIIEDWSPAAVDLSDYTEHAVVKVAFVFASDGSDTPGFGFMVDDILVMDDVTEIFADGAEDAENSEMTFAGGNESGPANQIGLGEPADAPSPTHALGTASTERGFYQFWVSPEFDMPEIEDGDVLWFNVQVNALMANVTNRAVWYCHVWDPENGVWHYASNIRGASGSNFIYVGGTNGWTDFMAGFGTDWIATNLAGVDGVRIRLGISVPPTVAQADFTHIWWDDVELVHFTMEHDIGFTSGYMPFPRTVGMPTVATVVMANLGPNAEVVPNFPWLLNDAARPIFPAGPHSLDLGESVVLTLDGVLTDNFAGWTPTTAGNNTVSVAHNLQPDDIPANNTIGMTLPVAEAGTWELGFDGSFAAAASNQAYWAGPEGALVHIVPQAMNPGTALIGHTLEEIKINLIWYTTWYGADPVDYELKVFAGGEMPGPVLWESDTYTFSNPDGSANLQRVWTTHELDTPLEFEAGEDYYLFYRPLSGNLTPGSPFEHYPFITGQANTHMGESAFSWRYNPTTGLYTGLQSTAWTMRGIASPNMEANMAPTEFALDFPGDVVQFPNVGFIWDAAMDPEGGPVVYDLTIMSGGDEVIFTNLMDNAYAVDLDATDLGAEPNQMYSWSVTARDYWGAETTCDADFEFRMADLAPVPFALSAPDNGVQVSSVSVDFTWEESHSPEGFDVAYTLYVESNGDQIMFEGLTTTSQTVDLAASDLGAVPFQEYTWHVEAEDSEGRTRMSEADFEFTMYDLSVAESTLPTEFAVSDLYPNPFNPSTSMSVALPTAADVQVQIFDVLGRRVANLTYGQLSAGRHHLTWGDNNVSSGLYIFVVKAGPLQVTRKAVFMK